MITGFQNLHTHTTYCDGELTPEEMIKAALQLGGTSIGFSEHSYVPFDKEYSMKLEDTPKYISEVNALKSKYEGVIDVFLGIEMDYFTDKAPDGMEYIIGTVHHVEKDGNFVTVDGGTAHIKRVCLEHFGGDYYSMAESYYKTVSDVVPKTGATIVGHFDLITKRNLDGSLFDESHPRYINAALSAMDKVVSECNLFEVNTGAMFRAGKTTPYPSEFLLRELNKRGGEVLLTSDSHSADSLYYKFDEMRELLKSCGYNYIKRLTNDGFIDEELR